MTQAVTLNKKGCVKKLTNELTNDYTKMLYSFSVYEVKQDDYKSNRNRNKNFHKCCLALGMAAGNKSFFCVFVYTVISEKQKNLKQKLLVN